MQPQFKCFREHGSLADYLYCDQIAIFLTVTRMGQSCVIYQSLKKGRDANFASDTKLPKEEAFWDLPWWLHTFHFDVHQISI